MITRNLLANNRGTAMVVSLLLLLVLTMLGTLFVAQTRTEVEISGHDQRSTQAFFNAEAGYAEMLARMSDPSDTASYIGPPVNDWQTNPGWGLYIVANNGDSSYDPDFADAASDGMDNNGNGSIDEDGETYTEISTVQSGGDAINYPWVKVRYRLNNTGQVVLFGDHDNSIVTPPRANLIRGWPILLVSAEGQQGNARRRVEVEAVKFPFDVPAAAVYAEDDDFKFNGTAFEVSGEDHDPVTWAPIPGNPEVAGIATTEDPDNISGAMHGNQINNVNGEGPEPSVDTAEADLDLEMLRDMYSPMADPVLPGGTYSNTNYGGLDDYKIVHVTGDMHVSGGIEGGGLLLIDGDLTCTGQFTWYGLVVVLGDIQFAGGGASIHIFGATFVQGGIDDQVVGGNADLLYSSQALARLAVFMPYTVAGWREL
jgi:hypothetical protein